MDKLRSLVVDDESSVCEAVKAILELEGLDVTTTISSVDAVEMVRKNGYDLILLRPDLHVAWRGNRMHSEPRALAVLVTGHSV